MTALGTSFTRWRAEARGLDDVAAFERLCGLGFAAIRLSASWREISKFGFQHLDRLLARAQQAGQPVLLTVGMKALGWPEFYLPQGLEPADPSVQRQALAHVRDVVRRYRGHPTLIAWQVENEPFNRSGPQARWIPRAVVRAEAQAVRQLDPGRPIAITTFARFDEGLDRASNRFQSGWRRRLGLQLPAEREALSVLRPGDLLGLDVYGSIGWMDQGVARLSRAAADQLAVVERWQHVAAQQSKRLWVMEAQAEPWEAQPTGAEPLSVRPQDVADLVRRLSSLGVEMVLLWGCEYWLQRADNGDRRWLETVEGLIEAAKAQPRRVAP
jgi:glycosyl hydrolase family 2